MKEEDGELSDDLAENTQVWLLVIENSTLHFVLLIFIGLLVTHLQLSNGHCHQRFKGKVDSLGNLSVIAKYKSVDETLISQTHVFVTTNFVRFCPDFLQGTC